MFILIAFSIRLKYTQDLNHAIKLKPNKNTFNFLLVANKMHFIVFVERKSDPFVQNLFIATSTLFFGAIFNMCVLHLEMVSAFA